VKWMFFSYSLPARPSKARVYVWRQLKKLGAFNYQSLWIFPFSKERMNELRKLMDEIEGFKGESLLIQGKPVNRKQEEQVHKAYADSRNEEYREYIKKCEDFLGEIRMETERENFTFAEVEENEEEFQKLRLWLKKIERRDLLGLPLHKAAVERIKSCEKVFEDFARKVYERQS